MKQVQNTVSGAPEFAIVAKDSDGFDADPIYLGKLFSDSAAKLNMTNADQLRGFVQYMLDSKDLASEAKRAEIQKLVVAEVDGIKAERNNNLQDDVYRLYLEGGRNAVKMLKREN